MQCQSPIPIVVEGRLPDPPRSNPYDAAPRFSNNFFQGQFPGLREPVDEDGDESMSSSPGSFDTTSPLTGGFGSMGSPTWFTKSSPHLAQVDSGGLSAIGNMNLRDGSISPMPKLESVGEEVQEGKVDLDRMGIFGMELNVPVSAGEDAVMADLSSNC